MGDVPDTEAITITLPRNEAHALLHQWAIGEGQYGGPLGRGAVEVCERARVRLAALLDESYERTL